MKQEGVRRAGVYARLSLDASGMGLAVQRQVEDCTAKAALLDWDVSDRYVDNDLSATKAKSRPQFERLLADLESGALNAVVVYDLDRLTRRPAELESFIDLAERLDIALANVAGDVDLTTASGRMVARIKGAVARQEADRIGERVKRQKQQRLSQGKPPGSRWRTFGYTRDWQIDENEAAFVREAFQRVARGESLNSVTKDFVKRGVTRVSGSPWTFQATSRLVDSPIYAGILTYKGERAGTAEVPPLVSEELFESASNRARQPGRINARKHLLSSIAVCGLCRAPMTVTGGASDAYVCNRQAGGCGRVRIKRAWLDEAIENAMKSHLFFESFRDEGKRTTEDSEDTAAEISAVDSRIEMTQDALTEGRLAYEDGLPILQSLRAKRARLVHASSARSRGLVKPLENYEQADVSLRSAEVRRRISAIVVRPVSSLGRTTFEPDRFEVMLPNGDRVPGTVVVEQSMRFATI